MMRLDDIREVYFIGIGGIGMSALARFFVYRGVEVSGYDRTATDLTRALEGEGIAIHYGAADVGRVPHPHEGLLVIYTPAVPVDFAERRHVASGNYTLLKRSEVLGLISRGTTCVAIAGTHGKTTTTTLTTHLMAEAGLRPTAFLGGISHNFSTNFVAGRKDLVVVEADEYDRSFLQLDPSLAVILSADPDHLDIYHDHETMLETGYGAFARRVAPGGALIVRHDILPNFAELSGIDLYTFGIGEGDYRAENVGVRNGAFYFDLVTPGGERITDLRTTLPGRHNVENAVAAGALTLLSGGNANQLREGLKNFRGILRRFDRVFDDGSLVIIDDYAHHPTELRAAIGAAKELYPNKKIYGVFQPHLFSRTQDFSAEFASALDELDEAVLIPIYPAREEPIEGVDSNLILRQMDNPLKSLKSDKEMLNWAGELREGVLLLLGAGDIDVLIQEVSAHHSKRIGV